MSNSGRVDDIALLKRDLIDERAAREEAEQEVEMWRQKTIDIKLNSLRTRIDASSIVEELVEDSRTSRASALNESDDSSRMRKELEAIKEQRDHLLEVMTNVQIPEEGSEAERNMPIEERLEKERQRRRSAETALKTLNIMFTSGEMERAALQDDAAKLQASNERSRTLLHAAETLLRNNCPSRFSDYFRGKDQPLRTVIIPAAVGALAAVATIAVVFFRKPALTRG